MRAVMAIFSDIDNIMFWISRDKLGSENIT